MSFYYRYIFLRDNQSGNMVGHDQELRKFDAGEGHFEEQHI